jgi:uncharacterized protein YpuA (DUF1002 family)
MTTISRHHATAWTMLAALALVIGAMSASVIRPTPVSAADSTTVVAIGESNNADERAELLGVFGVEDSPDIVDVTVDETLTAWDGIFDLTGVDSAYSSTALTCGQTGSGVAVSTSNIEIVPPELYALTLVTAGLTDVELIVAAPDDAPALGMTALTGVFKSWDLSSCAGTGSDSSRRTLALQQLALVAGIGEAHGGAEAVRSTTNLLLASQQAVVLGEVGPADMDALVTAQADEQGLTLSADEQAGVVDFLDQLAGAGVDWNTFATEWTVDRASDTQVVMRPGVPADSPAPGAEATGVGGAIGTIRPAPATATATAERQPTQTPEPTATVVATATAQATATATTAPAAGITQPTDSGGSPSTNTSRLPSPWWLLLALLPLSLLALLILRRHRRTPLLARQRGLVSAGHGLAQRRTRESAAVAAVMHGEPTMRPVQRRSMTWRIRPRQVDA